MQRGRVYSFVQVMIWGDGPRNLHPICTVPEGKGPVG